MAKPNVNFLFTSVFKTRLYSYFYADNIYLYSIDSSFRRIHRPTVFELHRKSNRLVVADNFQVDIHHDSRNQIFMAWSISGWNEKQVLGID